MISKAAAFGVLLLASALALCWVPLGVISQTHLVDTQILFYAFSSAALITSPFLFIQASKWRPHVPAMVTFSLISALACTLLQYSLLAGNSLVTMSIFCITFSALVLFSKTESNILLELIVCVFVAVLAVAIFSLFGISLTGEWTEWSALVVAVLIYILLRLHNYSSVIPLGSKLAVSLIASTWLVGMVTIFSQRFSSYIQDNAISFSVAYGVLFLAPVTACVLYLLSNKRLSYIFWSPLLLLLSILSFIFRGEVDSIPIALGF